MTPLSNTSAHTGIDRPDDVPHGSIQLDDPMPLDNPSLGDSTVHDISSPPRDPASEDQPMSQAYPHEHDELMLPYNPPPVDTTIRSIPQPPEFSESRKESFVEYLMHLTHCLIHRSLPSLRWSSILQSFTIANPCSYGARHPSSGTTQRHAPVRRAKYSYANGIGDGD